MTGRPSAALRLTATVAALAVGQALLWRAGSSLPTLGGDGALTEAEPVVVAVSALRLLAMAVGAALLGMTALGVAARCCGPAGLVVRVDRWTPTGIRRLLDGALGAGLAASIGLSALPSAAGEPGGAAMPVSLRRLPDEHPGTGLRRLSDAPPARGAATTAAGPPPTLRRLPDDAPPVTTAAPASASAEAPGRRGVVVRPGDSFWLLAERHETERLGRQPSEAEVGACWQEMVATNRHLLAVPGDPDLVFPGQVLILPCP